MKSESCSLLFWNELSLGDDAAAVEFLHQEGQHGGFGIRAVGLERPGAQAGAHSRLETARLQEDAQPLRHAAGVELQIPQPLPENLHRLQ